MSVALTNDTVLLQLGDASAEVALKVRGSLLVCCTQLTLYPDLSQGATVFSYKQAGQERLFASSKSSVHGSDPAAIRGGIPICWYTLILLACALARPLTAVTAPLRTQARVRPAQRGGLRRLVQQAQAARLCPY